MNNSYSDDLRKAGFGRQDISAGNAGEKKVMALLKGLEEPGLKALRGVTFEYRDKGGSKRQSDADIVIIAGDRIYLVDAKQWKSGRYARRFVFGPVRLFPLGGKRPVKYPEEKGWPSYSALGPVGDRLSKYLDGKGVKHKIHKRVTVMTNPKSTIGFRVKNTTRSTVWMDWVSFERTVKRIRPGDPKKTDAVVASLLPLTRHS